MVDLNCDMGEGFGIYSFADDEEIMPYIDAANVACGFHASDPNTMRKTVELAKKYDVKVGSHPAYPDLVGFGRRPMKMKREEIKNLVMYQTGAIKAFLDEYGMPLNHIKPHGSLYGVSAKEEDVAHGIADAAEIFNVGIFGMVNTFHEKVYKERGVKFYGEFYSDLEYDETGWPFRWEPIATGTTPIFEDTLGTWDITDLPDGDYNLRLVVESKSGKVSVEDEVSIRVEQE